LRFEMVQRRRSTLFKLLQNNVKTCQDTERLS
jgi:hypothetical protein